ncbi:MAG: alpha/beta hydrolase [Chloroflexi bacterium]|nr:alpha/beta hydrolase [Chloroflexota bacterium]
MPIDVARRNNVRLLGNGEQPMIFAHGFGCDQNMWRFITPAFADDYRMVLFDYVGSGKSDTAAYDPRRYGSLRGYSRDVLEIIRTLDLRDVVFVGHSVSSMIGVLAAVEEPDRFSSLVLVSPSPSYLNDPPDYHGGFERGDIDGLLEMMDRNYIGWASYLAPVIMKNEERPDLSQELEASFCSTDPVIARRFAEVTFFSDNREDLPRVSVPALVIQSAVDALAPPEVGRFVARAIPNGTYREIDAVGHCPHMSHPELTVAAMREYLRVPAPA